jgi:glutamate--cysteine ligase
MTFCGIHVNFSLSEDLLREDFALSEEKDYESYRNGIYLGMARNLMENGWIANVLLSASPLLDRSFLTKGLQGGADFLGMASIRCSELGYWNHFVPTFDFSSLQGYAESIRSYIREGLLISHTELYYPIRIKSRGENSLEELVRTGVDHLELRCVDLNPFAFGGLDLKDLKFLHLLFVYDACLEPVEASREWQIKTVMNFKNASRYDIDGVFLMRRDREVVSVRQASLALLSEMKSFFDSLGIDTEEIMDYQLSKLLVPGNRYAERVRAMFSDAFVEKGLQWMKEKEDGGLNAI